jgi:hypothetical protein
MDSSPISNAPPILREHVEEGGQVTLPRAPDGDVASRRQCGAGPRSSLDAVRQGAVRVAPEAVDTFDPDRPVGVDADDRAHLLQHVDEVEDLWLGGGVAQLGQAHGADRGEQTCSVAPTLG